MLDTPTLLFAVVLDDLVLAAALWLAIVRRERRGVGAWCASLVLQALSFALVGMRASDGAELAASVVAVNGAMALGLTLQLGALFAFYRRPFPRALHLVAALGCACAGGVLAAHPAPRIAVVGVAYAAAMGAIGVAARRLHGQQPGGGQRLVAYGSFAGAAVLLARAVAALVWPARIGAAHGLLPSLSMLTAHAITLTTSLGFLHQPREKQEHDAERLAMTDALTGVYNRRTLFELGDKELSRARRTGASLSLILLDLDHFKRVNDKFGHLGGDAVLVRFAEVVRGCLRTSDVLTRYGGEEFCVLLPDVGIAGAKVVGERIRSGIEGASFAVGGEPIKVTASAGVASLPSGATEVTLSMLVARADQALYVAKRDGRNRVSVSKAA